MTITNTFLCLTRRRSPVAYSSFGFCRDRNDDGLGMDVTQIARCKRESYQTMREFEARLNTNVTIDKEKSK
jgi:hypothetical protein